METIECTGGVFPSGCKTQDGKLLFPTMKGLSVIDPDMMKTVTSYFSPVCLEEFLVDGHPVKITSNVSLPSYSNRFEFHYASLNYSVPEKIKYRCKLAGFDKEWIECGSQRSVHYTNIPGGNYTFTVMASNESGQWNDQSRANLKFHLKPPFYRSLLFYLVIATFFLLLAFFVSYYFLERFERRKLKVLVDERTHELNEKMVAQMIAQQKMGKMNADLIIAKEQAESGDRLKTAFMHNIPHEIRTPLNGILGFGSLISQPDASDEERALYYSHMEFSSERLLTTVTNYLDISLIVSRNVVINSRPFKLYPVFESILNSFRALTDSKDVRLNLEVAKEDHDFTLNSDSSLVKKVLVQLLDNAVKFTPTGHISAGYTLKPGKIEFFVADTGTGISPAALQRIFEGFFQGELRGSWDYDGSGLGLTIAQGFVKVLGGEIRVKSSKGDGTCFSFELPGPGKNPLQEHPA
jgi:signal transduction histidine kinase